VNWGKGGRDTRNTRQAIVAINGKTLCLETASVLAGGERGEVCVCMCVCMIV